MKSIPTLIARQVPPHRTDSRQSSTRQDAGLADLGADDDLQTETLGCLQDLQGADESSVF